MHSTITLAVSDVAAREYLPSRRADTEALIQHGLGNLPYAKVQRGAGGAVFVNDTECATVMCAIAFILRTYW